MALDASYNIIQQQQVKQQWLRWAQAYHRSRKGRRRRCRDDSLLSEDVDGRAIEHMQLPTQISLLPQEDGPSMMYDELLASFGQQSRRKEEEECSLRGTTSTEGHTASSSHEPLVTCSEPLHYQSSCESFSSEESRQHPVVQSAHHAAAAPTAGHDEEEEACGRMASLKFSESLIEQQKVILRQIQEENKNTMWLYGQKVKVVPQSKVQEAFRKGQAIRVTCAVCAKKLLATSNMTMVYCPSCGTLSSAEVAKQR